MPKKSKIQTPDWILKGKEKPKAKIKSKVYKVRKCPKCKSAEIGVVLGIEEGRGKGEWECRRCKWKGVEIINEEVGEEEFLKIFDKGD